jgi:tetratricopeptide (TPR) repeat protein
MLSLRGAFKLKRGIDGIVAVRDRMPLRHATCLLVIALGAAACGDDSAARECQDPTNPRRQVAGCTRLIASEPKSAKAYNNRCQAHNELREYEKSVADCDMAIKLSPGNASAYNNRGVAYEMKGEFDAALKDYDKAVALSPRFAVAYANRGDVYAKKGDRARAIAEYRQALEIEPDNDVALSGLKKLGAKP